MSLEMNLRSIVSQEPPRRVLDNSSSYFPDFGYKTASGLINSLKQSLRRYQMPHIIYAFGEPENGKEHIIRDIIAKLYYNNPNETDPEKRGKGLVQRLEKDIPIYLIGWGFNFSILKSKGLVPEDLVFGQFTPEQIDLSSKEEEQLLVEVLKENSGRRALIVVKNPTVAGARLNDEFFGANLGYTVAKKIAKRTDGFAETTYKDFWVAGKAEPEVEIHGDTARPALEKLVDKPDEFLTALEAFGETVLLPPEGLTKEVMSELNKYGSLFS